MAFVFSAAPPAEKYFCECEGYAKSVRGWTYCPHCSNMELAEDIFIGVIDTGGFAEE